MTKAMGQLLREMIVHEKKYSTVFENGVGAPHPHFTAAKELARAGVVDIENTHVFVGGGYGQKHKVWPKGTAPDGADLLNVPLDY